LIFIRQCSNPLCRLRFPADFEKKADEFCPLCGKPLEVLEYQEYSEYPINIHPLPSVQLECLVDNVRSIYNVGSIFRTSDGLGLNHIHLCGITPTPDNPKLAKTALGAEQSIGWSYHRNSLDVVSQAKLEGKIIFALESTGQSQSIFVAIKEIQNNPVLLVVGNEVHGVDPEILSQSDKISHIPMFGKKESFNVATAFGIAAFLIRFAENGSFP
jgi:23S rRNA (guanosine2251-2'-O)-methyltransferase